MNDELIVSEVTDYKIVCIGNSGVGKTSLIKLYENGSVQTNILPSVGLEFTLKLENINQHNYQLKIWDTSGQEKYRSMARSFYKNCKGFLVVFAVDDLNSFMEVERWISEIADNCAKPCWILVGNKTDLPDREVSSIQAYQLAKKYKVPYCETTIFEDKRLESSQKINEVFNQLVHLLDNNEERPIKIDRSLKMEFNSRDEKQRCSC